MTKLASGLTVIQKGEGAGWLEHLPAFTPRAPWFGGDLQTVRNRVIRVPRLVGPSKRATVPLRSREAGSLVLALNSPENGSGKGPLVLLVHGLGGCEDSAYMRFAAQGLLDAGYDSIRLNLRGAGPSAKTSRGPYHAGLTDDLRDVLLWCGREFRGRPVIAIGFSLGGHMLLRLAGEGGELDPLCGVMTVCAPVDLFAVQERIAAKRNRVYHAALVRWMKRDARTWLAPDSPLSRQLPTLGSIRAFDSAIVAPAHGFSSVESYYHDASMQRVSDRITVPVLAIHSSDDPWIPLEGYRQTRWPDRAPVAVVVTCGGGHVGFHGKGAVLPWYVPAARHFIQSVMS